MDHNQIQKAIEQYNQAINQAVAQYEKALADQQQQLFTEIKALGISGPQGGDDDVVVMSRAERDKLAEQLAIVSKFIAAHPELKV